MKTKIQSSHYLIIALFFSANFLLAQFPSSGGMAKMMKDIKGRVYGKIIDTKTKKPIPFANVVVLWYNKDSVLSGGLTAENGEFNIENLPAMGGFRFRAMQIGYKKYETKIYIQMPNKIEQDLGDIGLEVDEKLLSEVEVKAEKSAVVLSIDKRSYNVEKDISVRGGTAVDVMKNVPGVTVDADGNAQLRNQSPTIFVDGRPTNLTLQQIPADQIERVEVITNPSVKYDANTTGGILNIILKKNLKPGYNGMIMAYAGTGDRYGGMTNLNVKEGKLNFSAMYNYNQGFNNTLGYTHRKQLDSTGNASGYFNQDNKLHQGNIFNFGKIGLDYMISNRRTFSINTMMMMGQFKTNDNQFYDLRDKDNVEKVFGKRVNDQFAQFHNNNVQLLYKRTYPKAGEELTIDLNGNFSSGDNGYLFSTYSFLNPDSAHLPTTFQKNTGYNNSSQGVFQVDYTNPISETKKFECGIKSFYKESSNTNFTSRSIANQDFYTLDSSMSNHYLITEITNAAYVNYNSKTFWDISYQAGLRFEQSYYKGIIADKNEHFSYTYPLHIEDLMKSIFPGIYLSKKLGSSQEIQLNFTRKINRPNFFQMMPVVMFADAFNYRIGNPQLRPEFRNMAELNYNKTFSTGSYLGAVYLRHEEQPITDVAYPDPDPSKKNILVNTSINGKSSLKYGMEHTIKLTLFKNLEATINGNVFYIYIKGIVVQNQPEVTAKGYAFNSKANLSYKFPKQLTLQINGNYESPKILLLGSSIPISSMDLSINKMIGTKWVLNATLSDVFNSRRMGTHYVTPYYIQDLSRRREMRYLRFNITYMFGKMDASIFKRAKQMRNNNDNQGNQDGLDFK